MDGTPGASKTSSAKSRRSGVESAETSSADADANENADDATLRTRHADTSPLPTLQNQCGGVLVAVQAGPVDHAVTRAEALHGVLLDVDEEADAARVRVLGAAAVAVGV